MASAKPYDWTQFTLRIIVNASVEQCFQAWADDRKIIKWFPEIAVIEPKRGGRLFYQWVHEEDRLETRIIAFKKNKLLHFPFGTKGEEVKVSFCKLGKRTIVELQQIKMKTTPKDKVGMHMGCKQGWTFFLVNLKAWLEHSVDLRGHDPKHCYRQDFVNS